MRIAVNIGGDVLGNPSSPAGVVTEAVEGEREGFRSAWTVHFSRAVDALTTLAVAGQATERIELGVGVVPTYPRHPLALAQQAATAQAFCGGRLTLGVGVSHRPVIEGLHGMAFARPAAHMREYLSVLVPLLNGDAVDFDGEHYRVHGGFTVPGTSAVSVLVGGLSPQMVRAAGELADGVVTWLAGPRTIAEVIAPTLRAAAETAGRPAPRLVAGLPVAVTDDVGDARRATEDRFGRYNGLENYQRVYAREGVSAVGELAIIGDESTVEQQLRRYADAGVTELWPVVFPAGDDPAASRARTRSLLAKLAAEL
ncbi:TIGR03564 family F420-dependent LLM class oxidoreductase [Pseudonocardia sp. GCM10023141]|uniref:TIGR03564 family F420-dependent LLM class oxidoreductase n=1 Tax=Pseudonocardia sp. GCM10023141 TaxID=3252653 RepID=UPI003616964F